jgi:hypothetical protein
LNKLQAQLEKQKQEKQKAEEAAKKKAAEEYAKKLTDEAAKLAFEAKQKALADEKAKQAAAKAKADEEAAKKAKADADAKAKADAAAKAAADAEAARLKAIEDAANNNSGSGSGGGTTLTPSVTISQVQEGNLDPGQPTILSVSLKDYGNNGVFGAQLHFTYGEGVFYDEGTAEFLGVFSSGLFADQEVVPRIDVIPYECGVEVTCNELIVVFTKVGGDDLKATTNNMLIELPFGNESGSSLPIKLSKVIIVDKTGYKHIDATDVPEIFIVPGYNAQAPA